MGVEPFAKGDSVLVSFLGFTFVHVLREQNSMTDKLANWGVSIPSTFRRSNFPEAVCGVADVCLSLCGVSIVALFSQSNCC